MDNQHNDQQRPNEDVQNDPTNSTIYVRLSDINKVNVGGDIPHRIGTRGRLVFEQYLGEADPSMQGYGTIPEECWNTAPFSEDMVDEDDDGQSGRSSPIIVVGKPPETTKVAASSKPLPPQEQ